MIRWRSDWVDGPKVKSKLTLGEGPCVLFQGFVCGMQEGLGSKGAAKKDYSGQVLRRS